MGESNCCDSRMAAYRQEVRKLVEKFNGFEHHHILRSDNEAVNTLTRLGSTREPPPPGVFTHDLFKPSIQLEEDGPAPVPGTPSSEDSPAPTPRTLLSKGGITPTLEADPGTSIGPIE
jgi:hypothetical protein